MKLEYYQKLLNEMVEGLGCLNKKSNRISQIRGLVGLVILLSFIAGYNYQNNIWYVLSILCVIIFVILVVKHNKIDKEIEYNSSKKTVLEKYICRFSDDWHSFADDGKEYLNEDVMQAKDLDIFGTDSLYQYISVANTPYGKDILAKHLLDLTPNREHILKCQEAVKDLSNRKEFSLKIQTFGNLLKEKQKKNSRAVMEQFINGAESSKKNNSGLLKFTMWALPFMTIALIILAMFGVGGEVNLILTAICILSQFIIVFLGNKKNAEILNPIFSFYDSIISYESIFAEIEHATFECQYLSELQAQLKVNMGAVKGLKKLDSISDAVKVRYNGIVYIVCNIFLMWDYHCVDNFDSWKKVYGSDIRRWLEIAGEIEYLLSLTVLCNVKQDYCFPIINENFSPTIVFENIKHPLIDQSLAVGNALNLKANTCVITGSNMSGKTTFLRSVGINLALAYSGAPVLAERFETSLMTIFTSMRVEDSVSKGISTFYAEILRIKQMVEYSKKSIPMISIIDEIFKGTNSADRIIGATEAIKKLSTPCSITFVSTHDFELCNLENDAKINSVNYHFSESYIGDEIQFDYKIKHGRCQTTNAQHLLRMAGIL